MHVKIYGVKKQVIFINMHHIQGEIQVHRQTLGGGGVILDWKWSIKVCITLCLEMHSFHGRWHWRQSLKTSSAGCVCCRKGELRNIEAQWSSIHSRNKPRWCLCMAKQMETVERQHECTEPHTPKGSTTHITQHLELFIGVCVNMEATTVLTWMYCVPGLFIWCSAVPSTVETMHFRTQGDMNFYAPFQVRNHPLKFVGKLKTHPVMKRSQIRFS